MLRRNAEITDLAKEIMLDITDGRIPLHNALLKSSRLSMLLDMPQNVDYFKNAAKLVEQNMFVIDTYKASIEAAKDRDVSLSSANPEQHLITPIGNYYERVKIREEAQRVAGYVATYRAEAFNFAAGVYTKWQFGNIAESVFEKKRGRTEPVLQQLFPDIHQRLNAIETSLSSDNPEAWKNAVVSCRTLLMDLADALYPSQSPDDKKKYLNRLKDFIAPRVESATHGALIRTHLDELKLRIGYVADLTQGSAHQDRPAKEEAENIVLYTYLVVSDLMEIRASRSTSAEQATRKNAEGYT